MQCHCYIICANDIGLLITIRLISMLDLDLEEDNKSEAGTNYDRAYISGCIQQQISKNYVRIRCACRFSACSLQVGVSPPNAFRII